MNAEDRNQMTDRLLDAALARYSDTKPRDGLEGRILANLAAHSTQRAPAWNRFWIPVACAAAIAIVAGLLLLNQTKHSSNKPVVAVAPPKPVQPQTAQPMIASTQNTTKPKRAYVPKSRAIERVATSRQPQFPAPTPPTDQEHLLAAYLNATPTHELLAIVADQQQWREQVQQKANASAQEPTSPRETNDLQISPPNRGNTDSDAPGAR